MKELTGVKLDRFLHLKAKSYNKLVEQGDVESAQFELNAFMRHGGFSKEDSMGLIDTQANYGSSKFFLELRELQIEAA